jgi:SAM-dependent methyltransferase
MSVMPGTPAHHHSQNHQPEPGEESPDVFWERRYAQKPQIWSGRVNPVLEELAAGLTPRRALDLGCGEGGDSLWLATRGWEVTAVDISATAIARGAAAAIAAGIDPERIHWVAADLTGWAPASDYELVSASFLQSPVALDRSLILQTAAAHVAAGGHLLVVSHAVPPPWASGLAGHHHAFQSAEQELAGLALPAASWEPLIVETRKRPATGPDGQSAMLEDAVVLLRRN